MKDDPGYARYFAYLNLFVVFMLVLVLGANFPVLFIGWEGVGLCSYLLIGFWFTEKANADAGKKAFIMNRIGDFGVLVAMFLLWRELGTLDFGQIAAAGARYAGARRRHRHPDHPVPLPRLHRARRAQIPLYTWLPDAMAGPTPVSALIHAATMVTAGRLPRGADQRALRAGAAVERGGRGRSARSPRSSPRRSPSGSTTSRRCWRTPPSPSSATCSSRVGSAAYRRRDLPPGDARLLQGAALPRRRAA